MTIVLSVFLFSTLSWAQEPAPTPVPAAEVAASTASSKETSIKSWFKLWRTALQKSVVEGRYRKMKSTSVAAVRGAGQAEDDPAKPYWKGSWSEKRAAQRMKERQELEAATSLVLEGKLDEAELKFKDFEQAHPRSGFLKEIKEARTQMEALKAETASPQPKP